MRVLVASEACRDRHHRELRRAAMAVDVVAPGAVATCWDEAPYDAVVADWTRVRGGRVSLVGAVRRSAAVVAVAGSEPSERVEALEGGADEVVGPMVDPTELALRLAKAVVRRSAGGSGAIRLGRVTGDRSRRTVLLDGRPAALTPHQRSVLLYLAGNGHRLVSAGELLDHCWDGRRDDFANPLPSQLTRLRSTFAGALTFPFAEHTGYRIVVADAP